MIHRITTFILTILSSRKFIFVIVGLLIIQAVWLAFTVQFPMAFDESYHFGLIQVYSHQWLPFITSEPDGASGFGVITRYDSYLYHYLMSFPYRIFASFTTDWASQIIFLRILNIGIFVGGIFAFSRLLRRFTDSRALVHVALLMLVLIPVVPLLAATINYDNLVFLLTPLVIGYTLTCINSLLKQHIIPASSLVLLVSVGLIGSLTKYAFVPIFAACLLSLFVVWARTPHKKETLGSIVVSFRRIRRPLQVLLVVLFVVTSALFAERYIGNLVMYHGFEPSCTQIKSLDSCISYGPWGRNYQLAAQVAATDPPFSPALPNYPVTWIQESLRKLFFTINYDFVEYSPLPVPYVVSIVFGLIGIILSVIFCRSLFKGNKRLLLLLAVIVVYVGALFAVNLSEFIKYRTLVAVNGRYLIMILPLLFLILGLAYKRFFSVTFKSHARFASVIFSVVLILAMFQGAGATSYLLHSQPIWYWQYQPLIDFNTGLKNAISPLIIGGKDS
jgi:hypothetical protein